MKILNSSKYNINKKKQITTTFINNKSSAKQNIKSGQKILYIFNPLLLNVNAFSDRHENTYTKRQENITNGLFLLQSSLTILQYLRAMRQRCVYAT